MKDNVGHQLVVKNLIEQVEQGQIPSLNQALDEVGYADGTGSSMRRSETFQKTLFDLMPFDWLAKKQKMQAMAWKLEKFTFSKLYKEEEIKEIMRQQDLPIITMKQDEDRNGEPDIWVVLVRFPFWEQIDKALDKIYKIAGLYSAEKHEMVTRPLEEMSDDELIKLSQENILPQPQATIEVSSA